MTESELTGPYPLMADDIKRMVPHNSIGVYVLYHHSHGETDTMYVGRTEDRPVRKRLLEHELDRGCTHFKFQYCSKKREAYEAECLLWHELTPFLQQRHPEKPDGKTWPCPHPECDK